MKKPKKEKKVKVPKVKKMKKMDMTKIENDMIEVTLQLMNMKIKRGSAEHLKLREELHRLHKLKHGENIIVDENKLPELLSYYVYDKYRNMSKKELREELKIAKMRGDKSTIFYLMIYLDKYNTNNTDSFSIDRKKYARIKCPHCGASSHKEKGSATELRRCKNGHTFTFSDSNDSATYKV
jgi:rRNA maturation protein Nop10